MRSPIAVSVIIPAYNAAGTLADTLESLLSQSVSSWEAVVVDDGSTDATGARAREYAERDARVRVLGRANGGEAAARNTGIGAARYDWLLFLDADDWIAPRHLEKLTAALAADRGLDAVHCGYARVAADGTRIVDPYLPPAGDMFTVWARRSAFPVHACIVRKALVESVGGFDASLRKSPDWDLWQRVARTGARFGAVRDVLAFYRMRPQAASLEASQMLRDGLRVLRQGHAPDPRVPNPLPEHANGLPPEQVATQAFYLLSWCAGLSLARGEDARLLLEQVKDLRFPELHAESVAQCLLDAGPLPHCEAPAAWERLWPAHRGRIAEFLEALEAQAGAAGLARSAATALFRMVLRVAPSWQLASEALEAESAAALRERQRVEQLDAEQRAQRERIGQLEAERSAQGDRIAVVTTKLNEQQRRAEQVAAELSEQRERAELVAAELKDQRERAEQVAAERDAAIRDGAEHLKTSERAKEALQLRLAAVEGELQRLSVARDALFHSPERRLGELLLTRLKLRTPLQLLLALVRGAGQRLVVARLALERYWTGRPRVVTTICWNFPIYSQTFVYQELTQLLRQGFALRLVYSKLDPRDQLPSQFNVLWRLRRRLFLHRRTHEADFAWYRARYPEKVETLIEKLCNASGLSRDALVTQGNFLEAFSFTRMAEAFRADYLHSYFFYDRSLMALVASYVLGIPRGITCYADHVLRDYELKVVPLHLELATVVVATSERIKRELLTLASQADPDRILVKPNGISTETFPVLEHAEPANGGPFRLISVCRIEPKKGLLDLVEAVQLLQTRGHRVEAHLVGAADEWSSASVEYKRQLDQRISELSLWGTVHLEGRQNQDGVKRLLGQAHLFVAPFVETEAGDKDGIPTALLEGMATGLPAVATDAGSITEVLINGLNGILVPQHNPAALADAIELLLRDPERRRKLGAHATDTIRRKFDVSSCERVFHERLRTLLPGGSGKRGTRP